MDLGEKAMAVVKYTVSVNNGAVTLTPDPNNVTFVDRDFLKFELADGTAADIKVKIVGGGLPQILVAIADQNPRNKLRLQLVNPPQLDADGSVLIEFAP